jgi:hypothetical protein
MLCNTNLSATSSALHHAVLLADFDGLSADSEGNDIMVTFKSQIFFQLLRVMAYIIYSISPSVKLRLMLSNLHRRSSVFQSVILKTSILNPSRLSIFYKYNLYMFSLPTLVDAFLDLELDNQTLRNVGSM